MLQLSAFWPHPGALQAVPLLPVGGGGDIAIVECPEKQNSEIAPTRCNCALQVTEAAIMQNRKYSVEGTSVRQHRGHHWRVFISKYTVSVWSFAAAFRSSEQQHPQQLSQQTHQETSGKYTHQVSQCRLQVCKGRWHVPCLQYTSSI
jgi:hypothetical protein